MRDVRNSEPEEPKPDERIEVIDAGGAPQHVPVREEVPESRERFRALTEYARDAIIEVTPEARLLYVSPSFTETYGYRSDDVLGVDALEFVHPEDRAEVDAIRVFAFGEGAPAQLVFRFRHSDGSWRWVEAVGRPYQTAAGELHGVLVCRDVTSRVRAERALQEQLEIEKRVADFSRDLLEAGAQGIDAGIQHGLETAGTIAGADRAFLLSTLGGDRAGLTVCDWHAPGVEPRPYAVELERGEENWILERLRTGEIIRLERIEDVPGEARRLREILVEDGVRSYLGIPVRLEGRLFGVLNFHCLKEPRSWSERELTLLRVVADLFASALRRKRAEARLEQSQQQLLQAQKMEAVGTLAGGIAHDFNNQLTVMLANARYVKRQVEGDPDLDRALEDLNRAAEHCAQLTRSLLAFARRTPDSPRSLTVDSVLDGAEDLLRPLIPSSIDFHVEARESQALVIADPTQLQQVLVNLVVNARDAMAQGGRLTLRAEVRSVGRSEARRLGLAAPGPYVEFGVRDTGTGMAEPVRARVFEPFFTTKSVGKGTGLGLATAYGIVKQCGGTIDVESEPGCGSTFRVLLPQSLEFAAGLAGGPVLPPPSGSGTLLLAEDDPGVRRLLARMLRTGGYEVLEAPNGVDALRLARQNADRLTALVADVDMPAIGGVELARRLARRGPQLPVLFISGVGADPLALGEFEACVGRSRFLAKPFTEQALLEALHGLLEGSEETPRGN
jgi:PAS domain S-box-containing protein